MVPYRTAGRVGSDRLPSEQPNHPQKPGLESAENKTKKLLTEMQCAEKLDAAPPPFDEALDVCVRETLGGSSHRLGDDQSVVAEAPRLSVRPSAAPRGQPSETK